MFRVDHGTVVHLPVSAAELAMWATMSLDGGTTNATMALDAALMGKHLIGATRLLRGESFSFSLSGGVMNARAVESQLDSSQGQANLAALLALEDKPSRGVQAFAVSATDDVFPAHCKRMRANCNRFTAGCASTSKR